MSPSKQNIYSILTVFTFVSNKSIFASAFAIIATVVALGSYNITITGFAVRRVSEVAIVTFTWLICWVTRPRDVCDFAIHLNQSFSILAFIGARTFSGSSLGSSATGC